MIKKVAAILFFFLSVIAQAQTGSEPQMGDALRESGKIYVVITVIGIIFLAIVTYLVMLDRKLKKLEDKFNKK